MSLPPVFRDETPCPSAAYASTCTPFFRSRGIQSWVLIIGLLLGLAGTAHATSRASDVEAPRLSNIVRNAHVPAAHAPAADDSLEIGGALRLNMVLENYESGIDASDGYFTIDMWRIDIQAAQSGLDLTLEYRFYPTFDTHFIKKGWIGYDVSEATSARVGIHQVPFGNLIYNSNSWWFQHGYYLGLEDNFGAGVAVSTRALGLDVDAAYFLQPAPAGPSSTGPSFGIGGDGRYSYDVIPTTAEDRLGNAPDGDQSLREMHQGNVRVAVPLPNESEVGASIQAEQLYNQALEASETATAYAAHASLNWGRFNVMPQVAYYNYRARNDDGSRAQTVPMGAYASGSYPVASEGTLYTLGLSYALPVSAGPLSQITFYNDYAYLDKRNASFADTQQNILGFSVAAGDVFTYVDLAAGKNHPWLTDDFGTGLGRGVDDPDWNVRFNINIGYYF